MEKLKVWKDYVNVYDNDTIVIDRAEDIANRGFEGGEYRNDLICSKHSFWREATEEEVIGAFKKHLIHRYGEDWRTMKIKERHPSSRGNINDELWAVLIAKVDSWKVWNKNGLLYCDGIWVERLEEKPKIHIKEAIKENTVIHCETEKEAKRILDMAHELGYKWLYGSSFKDYNNWGGDYTCYDLSKGMYGSLRYYINEGYTIILSTQIADLELPKSTGWSLSPEDIKELKAGEKADNRYVLKRDVLTILSVESKFNPDKKLSEYLEQFKLILEVL